MFEAYGMLGSDLLLDGNEEKAIEVWNKPFQSGNINFVFYRVVGNYVLERRAFDIELICMKSKKASDDKYCMHLILQTLFTNNAV